MIVTDNRQRWDVERASGWTVYEQALAQIDQDGWQSALALLAEAETIFRTENENLGLWRALLGQALLHWRADALVPSVTCALAALQAAETFADHFGVGCVAWQLANMALGQGDYTIAAEYLNRAQAALDRVDRSPPGGALAAAAQLCIEITRWRQAAAHGRIEQRQAEVAIAEIRPELITRLTQVATAMGAAQHSETGGGTAKVVAMLFPPALPDNIVLRPAFGMRLARWWRQLIGTEAPPDQELALTSSAAPTKDIPAPEASSVMILAPASPEAALTKAHVPVEQQQIAAGRGPGFAVYYFGSFRVYLNDTPVERWESTRGRALFKYIVARRATPALKETLAEQFWADSEPELARRSLHQAIYCLRQTFKQIVPDTPIIQFADDRYQINPQFPIWVDCEEFSRAIEQAHAYDTAGEAEPALRAYALAVDLYSGEFLEHDRYEEWAAEPRRTYQAVYLEALHRLARHHYERHDCPTAIILCQRALVYESCDEEAHHLLMACYVAQSLRHLAVRQYQICVTALKTELGLTPSDELEAFYRQLAATG
jgi:DNA-binding SARP family transcriptional activator